MYVNSKRNKLLVNFPQAVIHPSLKVKHVNVKSNFNLGYTSHHYMITNCKTVQHKVLLY